MAGSFFLSVGKQSLGSGTRFTQQAYKCQGLTLVPATWTVQKVRLHFWGEVYFPPVAKKIKTASVSHWLAFDSSKGRVSLADCRPVASVAPPTSSEEQLRAGAHRMLFDSQGKAAAIEKVRVRKHLPEYPGGLQDSENVALWPAASQPPPRVFSYSKQWSGVPESGCKLLYFFLQPKPNFSFVQQSFLWKLTGVSVKWLLSFTA